MNVVVTGQGVSEAVRVVVVELEIGDLRHRHSHDPSPLQHLTARRPMQSHPKRTVDDPAAVGEAAVLVYCQFYFRMSNPHYLLTLSWNRRRGAWSPARHWWGMTCRNLGC